MQLTLRCPSTFASERAYVFEVLLRRFLGIDFTCAPHQGPWVELTAGSRTLKVRDAFLGGDERAWLAAPSMPRRPLARLDTRPLITHAGVPHAVPVLYGDTELHLGDDEIRLGLDVFGSCFFMLTRYEEALGSARDDHERFPASASLALREGFLGEPLVNVYAELLWACLQRLWPALQRPSRKPRMLLSCDVDLPWSPYVRKPWLAVKTLARHLIVERSPSAAMRHLRQCAEVLVRGDAADPYFVFDAYMQQAESAGLRVAFYFIAGHTAGDMDGNYDLDDPRIHALLRSIHARGHEIGLHPSYRTYQSTATLQAELARLRETCGRLGIRQAAWGGRQHYLRWEPQTFRRWTDAGLAYDSTLTFAAHCGFRAGTCYEYPAYDLEQRRPLPLLVRPLVVMDSSLLRPEYMALPDEAAASTIDALAAKCRAFDGDFTLLWHNSSLSSPSERALFRAALKHAPPST